MTFNISSVFTDSLRLQKTNDHSSVGRIKIDRICGPVKQIDDTTFTVQFYRMGLNNAKRTGDIWLIAHHEGDEIYKSTVQQLNIRIPYPNKEGKKQQIVFDELPNIKTSEKALKLNATSDQGLPVYFYVKEGPVKLDNDRLLITKIPPRAKFPIKVTVVAWQYGRIRGDKIQTATAIKRSFYIKK